MIPYKEIERLWWRGCPYTRVARLLGLNNPTGYRKVRAHCLSLGTSKEREELYQTYRVTRKYPQDLQYNKPKDGFLLWSPQKILEMYEKHGDYTQRTKSDQKYMESLARRR